MTSRVLLMGRSLISVVILLQLSENFLNTSIEGSEGSNTGRSKNFPEQHFLLQDLLARSLRESLVIVSLNTF